MAFNPAPSAWFGAGYSLDSSFIYFSTNNESGVKALPQLTDVEANATTGDIRKVNFAIVEKMYQDFIAKAVADRPARMSIQKSISADAITGLQTNSYTFTFVNTISAQDVAAEPS